MALRVSPNRNSSMRSIMPKKKDEGQKFYDDTFLEAWRPKDAAVALAGNPSPRWRWSLPCHPEQCPEAPGRSRRVQTPTESTWFRHRIDAESSQTRNLPRRPSPLNPPRRPNLLSRPNPPRRPNSPRRAGVFADGFIHRADRFDGWNRCPDNGVHRPSDQPSDGEGGRRFRRPAAGRREQP